MSRHDADESRSDPARNCSRARHRMEQDLGRAVIEMRLGAAQAMIRIRLVSVWLEQDDDDPTNDGRVKEVGLG